MEGAWAWAGSYKGHGHGWQLLCTPPASRKGTLSAKALQGTAGGWCTESMGLATPTPHEALPMEPLSPKRPHSLGCRLLLRLARGPMASCSNSGCARPPRPPGQVLWVLPPHVRVLEARGGQEVAERPRDGRACTKGLWELVWSTAPALPASVWGGDCQKSLRQTPPPLSCSSQLRVPGNPCPWGLSFPSCDVGTAGPAQG